MSLAKANQHRKVMTVLGRLHRLAAALESGKPITATKIAVDEEISTKTVYRLIDFMRDCLGWDIASGKSGFRLISRGQEIINFHNSPK